LDWFAEESYWSGLNDAATGSREDHRGALRDVDGNSPYTQPPLKVTEIGLQVADEQRRLAGRGYDGRTIRVNGQLDVV
jgi:hypothetical protein